MTPFDSSPILRSDASHDVIIDVCRPYLGRMVSSGPVANYDTSSAVHWMTTGTAPNGSKQKPGAANPHRTEG